MANIDQVYHCISIAKTTVKILTHAGRDISRVELEEEKYIGLKVFTKVKD